METVLGFDVSNAKAVVLLYAYLLAGCEWFRTEQETTKSITSGRMWEVGSPYIRSLSEWRVRYWSWKEGISHEYTWKTDRVEKIIPLCWWAVAIARDNCIRFNEAECKGRSNYNKDSYDGVESTCRSLFSYSTVSSICIRCCSVNASCCR